MQGSPSGPSSTPASPLWGVPLSVPPSAACPSLPSGVGPDAGSPPARPPSRLLFPASAPPPRGGCGLFSSSPEWGRSLMGPPTQPAKAAQSTNHSARRETITKPSLSASRTRDKGTLHPTSLAELTSQSPSLYSASFCTGASPRRLGGVAQTARAGVSYALGQRFDSSRRHYLQHLARSRETVRTRGRQSVGGCASARLVPARPG
jgi:hypothetical protein